MKFTIYSLAAVMLFSVSVHAEKIAAPENAAIEESKTDISQMEVHDSSFAFVKKQLSKPSVNSDQLRKLGFCEIDKSRLKKGTIPAGSIVVRTNGSATPVGHISILPQKTGHLEISQDNTPWGGWNLATVKAVYAPCDRKG
ncbi:MAG: hypothetical protein ACXVA9_11890 [Bdellovibrionales bacterium]